MQRTIISCQSYLFFKLGRPWTGLGRVERRIDKTSNVLSLEHLQHAPDDHFSRVLVAEFCTQALRSSDLDVGSPVINVLTV